MLVRIETMLGPILFVTSKTNTMSTAVLLGCVDVVVRMLEHVEPTFKKCPCAPVVAMMENTGASSALHERSKATSGAILIGTVVTGSELTTGSFTTAVEGASEGAFGGGTMGAATAGEAVFAAASASEGAPEAAAEAAAAGLFAARGTVCPLKFAFEQPAAAMDAQRPRRAATEKDVIEAS
jgi:hypothetical protein